MKKFIKKHKKEKFVDIIIYSFIFPEGIYVGHAKDLDNIKYIFKILPFSLSYPVSYLLDKYDSIKPKIMKTVNLRKYGSDYNIYELYKYMREAIDECGYKPSRLLNKDLKKFGYNNDDVKKQKINIDIFFNNEYDDDDVDLGGKRRKSF